LRVQRTVRNAPRREFAGRMWRPGARAALVPALVSAALALALAACTTARERETPRTISGNLRFRNAETEAHFRDNYRSGSLYLDFRPAMIADAIFQDERYRALYLETLRDRLLVTPENLERLRQDEQARFDESFEFLVFLYGGSNVPVRLNHPNALWRLLLRDDDGDLLEPASMRLIPEDSPVYRYIVGYFAGLDRWSQLYLVRFPKLEKTLAGQSPGSKPFELMVTGVDGTITMRWENPAWFYRSPSGIQVSPGPPSAAPAAVPGGGSEPATPGAGDETG
jgi:hypothetical protein